jgi:sarcosine oxidase subunit gamma
MSRSPLDPALLKFPLVVSAREHAALAFDDLSARPRFGCKGPGAPSWLAANGYSVPEGTNSATVDAQGILVARLATSEFLIEAIDGGAQAVAASLHQLAWPIGPLGLPMGSSGRPISPPGAPARPLDLYPVARQDLVVGLQGPGLHTLLRQICSVDFVPLFEASGPHNGPIALTSMIGVGVVAWPRRTDSGSSLTVWLDPSFAHYFWTTLLEVGRGVGALVIGSNTI